MAAERYDPFVPGPFAAGVRTLEIQDRDRGQMFPCEIWKQCNIIPPDLR